MIPRLTLPERYEQFKSFFLMLLNLRNVKVYWSNSTAEYTERQLHLVYLELMVIKSKREIWIRT